MLKLTPMPMLMLSSLDSILSQLVILPLAQHHLPSLLPLLLLLLPLLPWLSLLKLLLLPSAIRRLTGSADRFLSRLPAPLRFPNVLLSQSVSLFLIALLSPSASMFLSVSLFQGPNAEPPPDRSPTPSATPSPSPSAPPSPGLSPRPPVSTSQSLTAGPSPSACPSPPKWRSAPPWPGRCASLSTRRLPARTALSTRSWLSTLTLTATQPR